MTPTYALRFVCVASAIFAIGLPVMAQGNSALDDQTLALVRCGAIADNGARLACYDKLAGHTPSKAASPASALPAPNLPSPAPAPALPAFQTTTEQFGSERLTTATQQAETALDAIESEATKVSFNPLGRFTVHLANGQIWQQIAGDSDKARFPRTGKIVVKIERGLIGSYNLSINDSTSTFKVRRVQ